MTTPGGGAYSAGTIFLQVVPSFRNFQKTVRQAAKDAEKAFAESLENGDIDKAVGKALDKGVEKSGRDAGQRLGEILGKETTKKLDSMLKNLSPVLRIEADTGVARREIDLLLKRALALRDKIELGIDVEGAKKAEAEFRQLAAQVVALDGAGVDIEANAHIAAALAELRRLDSTIDRIDGREIDIKVDRFMSRTEGATQALRGFNGWVLAGAAALPLLGPLLAVAAGGMIAFGTAAIGAAAGLGVLILGFSGVGDAVKALGKEQEDGAEQARVLAKSQRAAGIAVQDAQRGVETATRNAGEAARSAADAVQDAQRRVARAHKDSERDVRRATKAVERAERDLADAQRDSRQAQEDLREARKAAADDMLDLESKVKKGALDERQALIDLFEAQVAYNAAMADGGATNLEREQAAIALERARIAIADQRRENEALRAEQAKTSKEGVAGSERVQAAQERVTNAAAREKDAQTSLADAQAAVVQARLDGAERIADAQRALGEAQAAQARAGADGARSIADAQRNLAEAQVNLRDAMAQTTAVADASKDAMDKLSPAGKRFALFIHGLRGQFKQLRDAVQEGMLPGVETAMRNLLPYMPQLTAFLSIMGKALGDLFVQASKALTSPVWLDFFKTMGEMAPIFTTQFAKIFGNLFTVFGQLAVAFAPLAKQIGDALVRITDGWVRFLASEEGQKQLQEFVGYVVRVGPKVLDFFGSLFSALWAMIKALAPYGETIMAIAGAIFDIISAIPLDVLGVLLFSFLSLIVVIQVISGALGAFGSVVLLAYRIVRLFSLAALGWIALFIAIGIGLVILYTKCETFRNIVDGAFRIIGATINWLWEKVVKPVFNFIVGYLRFLWDVWSSIFSLIGGIFRKLFSLMGDVWRAFAETGVGKAIVNWWNDIVRPNWDQFIGYVRGFWKIIQDLFSGGVDLVVRLVNDYLIDPFNSIAEFFDSKPIKRIGEKKAAPNKGRNSGTHSGGGYATGGMVGGFSPTPTADNIPAWLTAGEFVLPVAAVKKLRAAFGDGFLSWLQGGGGYAKGGLVEFGRLLQSRQFRVSEHPAFGGVRGKHAKNSRHYAGQAIDVNFGPGGENDIEKRAIDAIVGLAKEYDLRTIWRTAGHFNHAHFDDGGSGKSILGKIGAAVGNAVEWAKDGPLSWLKGKVLGGFEKVGEHPFGKMVLGLGKNLLGGAMGKVADLAGIAGDFLEDDKEAKPKLYDQGGWLPPGLTQVANLTGQPELILTPEQAEQVLRGGGQYSITVPMMPTDSTPAEVADAVLFAARQIARGGVYAGKR